MPRIIQGSPASQQNSRTILNYRALEFPMSPKKPIATTTTTPRAKRSQVAYSGLERFWPTTSKGRIGALVVLIALIGIWFSSTGQNPYQREFGNSSQLTQLHNQLKSLQTGLASITKKVEALQNENGTSKKTVSLTDSIIHQFQLELDELNVAMKDSKNSIESLILKLKESIEKSIAVTAKDFTERLAKTEHDVNTKLSGLIAKTTSSWSIGSSQSLQDKVERLYKAFFLDGTGKVDWAKATSGAQIEYEFTSSGQNTDLRNTFHLMLSKIVPSHKWHIRPVSKPVDIVIGGPIASSQGFVQTERLQPGYCFSIPSTEGNITIILPTMVKVDGVHIDHVSPSLIQGIKSAPKKIAVYTDECPIRQPTNESSSSVEDIATTCWNEQPPKSAPRKFVGTFFFNYPEVVSQSFQLDQNATSTTRRVRFEILENHGDEYTCIYRLRVHGDRMPKPNQGP